jgi:hypothetical protein
VTLVASDVEGDALTFAVVTPPVHGTLSGTPPGLTYQPAPDFFGTDSFTFRASDGQADSNLAAVAITVTPVNDAPVAPDQAVTTPEDTPVEVTLLAADVDGDALTLAVVTPPAHGTLSGTPPRLTYTPAANEFGPDSFTFVASDGMAVSNVASVSIAVTPVNDAPVAHEQVVEAVEGVAKPIVLTATDVDGDPLTFAVVTPPLHGTLSGTPPDLVYVPHAGYTGLDGFTFRANDGAVDSQVATVAIEVVPQPNRAPDCAPARPDATALWPPNHKMREVRILGVSDADGDPVTIQARSIQQDEPVEGLGDGDRAPDATLAPIQVRSERSGLGNGRVYWIEFTASDGRGASCTGTVKVCVPHEEGGACVEDATRYDSTVR